MIDKKAVVEEAMKYWQPRLQLQNWEFGYEFVDKTETGSVYGDLLVVWDMEKAVIEICNKCPTANNGLEVLIVHEMLHIYTHSSNILMLDILTKFCNKKTKEIIYGELSLKENIAVDKIARILVNLRRENDEI